MPASWTTEEQTNFLNAERPRFLAAQREHRAPRFMKNLAELWFQKWSEREILFPGRSDEPLTTEENEMLGAAIEKRKKQLKSWMYWFVSKEKRASAKTDISWLKDAIGKQKGGRSLQPIELYQQRNKEMIEEHVKAEIDKEGAKTKKERMSIRRRVVADLWDNEREDVVAEIKQELEKQKSEGKNDASQKDTSGTLGENERTPDEYKQAIQALPAMLKSALEALAEATGWVLFVAAAGPNPSDNGHIYMENFYFGPVTPLGEDFQHSHDAFKEGFEGPFATHAKRCFRERIASGRVISVDDILAKHVRKARALKTKQLQYADDEDPVRILGSDADNAPTTNVSANGGDSLAVTPTSEVDFNTRVFEEGSVDVQHDIESDLPALNRHERAEDGPTGMLDVDGKDDEGSTEVGGVWVTENGDCGNDLRTDQQPRQLTSPTATRIPFAPGGPSSPIENAFARLAATAGSIPMAPFTPGDQEIDPVLLDVGNRSINHSSDDYQLPGAIIHASLTAPPTVIKTSRGGKKGRKPRGDKAGGDSENAPPTQTSAQKRAATLAAKKGGAPQALGVEEDLGGKRKRKARLNPDGEVFIAPVKAKKARVSAA